MAATVASRRGQFKVGWIAWLSAGLLLADYLLIAVLSQPVAAGSGESLTGLSVKSPTIGPQAVGPQAGPVPFMNARPPLRVVSYVDGETDTLVKTLANRGLVGTTVTGVETSPPGWGALFTITGAGTRPLYLNPGQEGTIAVHLRVGNCESVSAGTLEILDSIKVHYKVLGIPHTVAVGIGPYWLKSPATCPRSGFARPA